MIDMCNKKLKLYIDKYAIIIIINTIKIHIRKRNL